MKMEHIFSPSLFQAGIEVRRHMNCASSRQLSEKPVYRVWSRNREIAQKISHYVKPVSRSHNVKQRLKPRRGSREPELSVVAAKQSTGIPLERVAQYAIRKFASKRRTGRSLGRHARPSPDEKAVDPKASEAPGRLGSPAHQWIVLKERPASQRPP